MLQHRYDQVSNSDTRQIYITNTTPFGPQRKSLRKPDSALIGRFQRQFGNSLFHGNAEDESFAVFPEVPNRNILEESESKNVQDDSMDLDMDSIYGRNPSEPLKVSESLPWIRPQSRDFDLFSSDSNIDSAVHRQSIPHISPKSRALDVYLGDQSYPRTQSSVPVDSELFPQIDPARLCNNVAPFLPHGLSQSSHISHRDSGYHEMDESPDSGIGMSSAGPVSRGGFSTISPDALLKDTKAKPCPAIDRFRFRTILKAPTAMVNPGDVPESYLNKGNTYHLTVTDSVLPTANATSIQYRTFVRVSFDEEERRSDPAAFWSLWKESLEFKSQSRQKMSRAVNFAGQEHAQMQIEQVSLDGFCVTWTSHPDAKVRHCSIPLRFNFLSTDFTRSKGVKGISVRLCSKTEQVSPAEVASETEICYCKIKLFRDHGAERKQSNDVAGIHRKIERLKQQFNEPPSESSVKRKRGKSDSHDPTAFRYSKQALKRQDVWPPYLDHPSQTDFQDHIQSKIDALQRELDSSSSESLLSLRGDIGDDPDIFPIPPLGESASKRQQSIGSATGYSTSPRSNPTGFDGSSPEKTTEIVPDMSQRKSSGSLRDDSQDHPDTPVACFFTLFSRNGSSSDQYYRAIYPSERTVHGLVGKISEKYLVDSRSISCVLYINGSGLEILVDDDFVREIPEGQTMGVEIDRIPGPGTAASEAAYGIRLTY